MTHRSTYTHEFDPFDGEAPSSEPAIGAIIGGRYRIEGLLGRGGMGAVYRAVHRISGRRVALKWLLVDDVEMRRRFLREARALGAIAHPNVVGILDVGEHEGSVYLVMEHLEGVSLRTYAYEHGGVFPVADAVRIVLPAISGLAAAHRAGIVHRDVKPENLFVCLDRDGTPYDTKLLDFGVARVVQVRADDFVTHHGVVVGTPRYMSPEQRRGDPDVDVRADVYAIGVVLHELLTGACPQIDPPPSSVDAPDSGARVTARLVASSIPEDFAVLLARTLAYEPRDRFADVEALGRALEPFSDGLRFHAPREVHVQVSEELDAAAELGIDRAHAIFHRSPRSLRDGPSRVAVTTPGSKARVPTGAKPLDVRDFPPELVVGALSIDALEPELPVRRSRVRWLAALGLVCVVIGGITLGAWSGRAAKVEPRAARPIVEAPPPRPASSASSMPEPEESALVVLEPLDPPSRAPSTTMEASPRTPPPGRTTPAPTMTSAPGTTSEPPPTPSEPAVVHGRAGDLRPDDF